VIKVHHRHVWKCHSETPHFVNPYTLIIKKEKNEGSTSILDMMKLLFSEVK
jgi:hypothetical protein